MPENVGTNALISKVLAVSNAHTPVFPLLIPLGYSFTFFFWFFIYLKEKENILLLNFNDNFR